MQVSPSSHSLILLSSLFLGGRLLPSTDLASTALLALVLGFSVSSSFILEVFKRGLFFEESVSICEGQQYLRKPAGPQNLSRFSFTTPSLSGEQNLSGTHSSDSPQLAWTMPRMAKRITKLRHPPIIFCFPEICSSSLSRSTWPTAEKNASVCVLEPQRKIFVGFPYSHSDVKCLLHDPILPCKPAYPALKTCFNSPPPLPNQTCVSHLRAGITRNAMR